MSYLRQSNLEIIQSIFQSSYLIFFPVVDILITIDVFKIFFFQMVWFRDDFLMYKLLPHQFRHCKNRRWLTPYILVWVVVHDSKYYYIMKKKRFWVVLNVKRRMKVRNTSKATGNNEWLRAKLTGIQTRLTTQVARYDSNEERQCICI